MKRLDSHLETIGITKKADPMISFLMFMKRMRDQNKKVNKRHVYIATVEVLAIK